MPIALRATRWVNAFLTAGHFAAFLFVGAVLIDVKGGWYIPVVIDYNTWNAVNDTDLVVLKSVTDTLTDRFYPGLVLVWCSLVSGLHHLYAWRRTADYLAQIRTGFAAVRWVDYAISAPLMVVANDTLWHAPPEINALVLVAFVQMLIVVAGAAAESWWVAGERQAAWLVFAAASAAFAWMWARYWWIFALGSSGGVPVFVIVILTLLTVSFVAFPAIFVAKLHGDADDEDRNVRYEAKFWLASALAKIPLLVFFGTGFIARTGRVVVDNNDQDPLPDDTAALDSLIPAGLAALVTVVGVLYGLYRPEPPSQPYTTTFNNPNFSKPPPVSTLL